MVLQEAILWAEDDQLTEKAFRLALSILEHAALWPYLTQLAGETNFPI